MRLSVLIVASCACVGCASQFTRVDFKYTSATHMSYREAMTTVDVAPEPLVYTLSDAFRRQGATVLERKKLDSYFSETPGAQSCWEANSKIAQEEFNAYRANSFQMYAAIDRKKPFAEKGQDPACRVFESTPSNEVESWLLQVEFPPRSAQATVYTPTLDSFFVFGSDLPVHGFATTQVPQNVGIQVSTRLYLWAWRPKGGITTIYLEGRPFSGQIEAGQGNSIGWSWWQLTDGYAERNVVKSYVLLLQDYDRSLRSR